MGQCCALSPLQSVGYYSILWCGNVLSLRQLTQGHLTLRHASRSPLPSSPQSHGCGISWGWYLCTWWSGSWSFGSLRVSLEVLSLITITKIQVWISLVPIRRALTRLGLEVQIYSYHNQATTHSLYHSVHHLRVAHFCVTSCSHYSNQNVCYTYIIYWTQRTLLHIGQNMLSKHWYLTGS